MRVETTRGACLTDVLAMSWYLIISTLATVSRGSTSAAAASQQNYYHVWADYGAERIGQAFSSPSASACAVRTKEMNPTSASFMFNAFLGMCIPGGHLGKTFSVTGNAEGDLYVDLKPPASLVVISQSGATACIGIFEELLTYQAAAQRCSDMGYFLASVRNLAKLNLLIQLAGDRSLWVGCEDAADDGILVWKEDQSEVSDITLAAVFSKDKLNNYYNEDCCLYRNDTQTLDDYDCTVLYPFACEVSLVSCNADTSTVT